MSRSSFQRLALVTLVVLLATVATNRLSAYAAFGHHAAALAPMHRVVTVHTHEARAFCRLGAEARPEAEAARAMAEAQRAMARVQRELAREQRLHAEEARRMARALQHEFAREVRVVVN